MTGIAASLDLDATAPARVDHCVASIDAMPHRGAVRRDVRAGPFSVATRGKDDTCVVDRDGLVVAVDGEIHNRNELRSAGVDDAMPDAEVVRRCYLRWGDAAPTHMVGDYAFVIHDRSNEKLVAARDALGMRPLYLHRDGTRVLLATEAQSLLATNVPSSQPNELALALFIACEFSEDGYTLRKDIEALPPGHVLLVEAGRATIQRYWKPDPWRKIDVDDEEAARMFRDVFEEAVRCRLPRSGRIGVLLSGGLDSASIACQASALAAESAMPRGKYAPTAFHLSLHDWHCDETAFSDAVVERWGLQAINLEGRGTEMVAAARPHMNHPDLVYHLGVAPFEALITSARREGVDRVFTGLGGDEWLDETGGECVDALKSGRWKDVAEITGLAEDPLQGLGTLWWEGIRPLVPRAVRVAARPFRPSRYRRTGCLTRRWSDAVRDHVDAETVQHQAQGWPDASSAIMCAKLRRFGPRVGCQLASLWGAVNHLEVAHPFMDRRVFELALAMPHRLRLRRGHLKNKPLLRSAMRHVLPPLVERRRDAVEFSSYFRDLTFDYRDEIDELFRNSRLQELGIIEVSDVRAALDAGLHDLSSLKDFGLVLSMELWLRQSWS